MDQTTLVINALDDSNKISIEYKNRFWLRANVEKMNIRVCAEDCGVDFFDIEKQMENESTLLIQHGTTVGRRLKREEGFCPDEEALLLLKQEDGYLVFLYLPEE